MSGDMIMLILVVLAASWYFFPEDPRDIVIREQAAAAKGVSPQPGISDRVKEWLIKNTPAKQ